MQSSENLPKAILPSVPASFWSTLAEKARRIMMSEESRTIGGISRMRPTASDPGLAVPLSTFKMIGLAEIKAKLADRWPTFAEKVHLVTRNTISKHLIRGDAFEQYGDDGYLVLFATIGEVEAEFKSRVIEKELARHLLGENGADAIRLSTLCTTIALSAVAGADPEGALREAMTRATPPRQPSASTLARSQLEAKARSIGLYPIESPDAPDEVGAKAEAVEDHPRSYSPVWDLSQMTLLRFRASLVGAPPSAESDSALEPQCLGRDLILIRNVIEDLRRLLKDGRRLPVTIPIHHASLSSDGHRTRLYRALAETSPLLRKLITVEICFPRDEFWTYACKSFMETARSLGMGWSALIALEEPRAIPPGRSWLSSVGTEIPAEQRNDSDVLRLMTDFGERSRTLNLECTLYGLTSRPLVLGAVGAGFRFLSGPAIQAETPSMAKGLRFEPLDLYRDLLHGPIQGGTG